MPGDFRPIAPSRSTFRATLSCKRTALFCRLPLPTLIYWPEAAHLGDLLRLLVRPGVVVWTLNLRFPGYLLPLVFKGRPCIPRFGLLMKLRCSSGFRTLSRGDPISRVLWSLCGKGLRGPSPPHCWNGPVPAPSSPATFYPLRGKEISSRGHGQRPKGRFSVTA